MIQYHLLFFSYSVSLFFWCLHSLIFILFHFEDLEFTEMKVLMSLIWVQKIQFICLIRLFSYDLIESFIRFVQRCFFSLLEGPFCFQSDLIFILDSNFCLKYLHFFLKLCIVFFKHLDINMCQNFIGWKFLQSVYPVVNYLLSFI